MTLLGLQRDRLKGTGGQDTVRMGHVTVKATHAGLVQLQHASALLVLAGHGDCGSEPVAAVLFAGARDAGHGLTVVQVGQLVALVAEV